jgi:hypothetical protein
MVAEAHIAAVMHGDRVPDLAFIFAPERSV